MVCMIYATALNAGAINGRRSIVITRPKGRFRGALVRVAKRRLRVFVNSCQVGKDCLM